VNAARLWAVFLLDEKKSGGATRPKYPFGSVGGLSVMKPTNLAALAEVIRQPFKQFTQEFEPLRPDLYRYCRYLTHTPWDAEDSVQDLTALLEGELYFLWGIGEAQDCGFRALCCSNSFGDEISSLSKPSLGLGKDLKDAGLYGLEVLKGFPGGEGLLGEHGRGFYGDFRDCEANPCKTFSTFLQFLSFNRRGWIRRAGLL
jgi:hypothetical protein